VARVDTRTRATGVPSVSHMDHELKQKLSEGSGQPDAAGHIVWGGRRERYGRPVIKHDGLVIPAAAAAFQLRTGRLPVGMCRADCDVLHCVAPEHVLDDLERRAVRLQLRDLHGRSKPWDACPSAGHSWAEHGRVEPDLTLYCRACNTARNRRSRAGRATVQNPTERGR
jgi:hypothetical protein